MADINGSYRNRYPTEAPKNFQSSNPEDAANADNGLTPWVSKPNPEETYNVEAGERFKQQGNLPKRSKLHADEGTIETAKGDTY
jgi:hypothetical protein